jgi:RNA polymerase sigma-70 factor, ECF subfamily
MGGGASQLSRPLREEGGQRRESVLVGRAIARAKRRDPEGLHFLYVRFAPDVRRYVASIVRCQHEAEDITQNVFTKLMTAIQKYERQEAPFAAWILRVARNAALDHLRSQRAIPFEEVRLDDRGGSEPTPDQGLLLRHALRELPEDQRRVLVLRHIVGLSPTEIADRLDRTESSVNGLHHRGRRALKANLRELGASPVVAPETAA